jgi:hypothetical protein
MYPIWHVGDTSVPNTWHACGEVLGTELPKIMSAGRYVRLRTL